MPKLKTELRGDVTGVAATPKREAREAVQEQGNSTFLSGIGPRQLFYPIL